MIQSEKEIKESKVVHFHNDAEPLDNRTKYYACVWFTNGSCMFSNYIYAKDRAQAFYEALNHFADNVIAERFGSAKDTLYYVASVSITEVDWED